ncbi:bifunctional serine/threonine-protein kinase/formylglycine-generating enzyme family protein [Okeania sp. SIO2B3]|uniref:bifunctional serine/threonine-protein kinase/formylglycine-generating enzyme family protein n=1 Tax=Okeania sp. SIO2B3 TaxID=2607784 RepID=UPI0013C0A1C8|nr:bifunctional serine/threonine-protein kinase/formylglycine-generating enzyme family protein [Okeania sp. SIO2B3]NET43786.1 SUMF1/EgtB/PvdO family nonheme iron enzyme [Okeania sp. SIO2B3]
MQSGKILRNHYKIIDTLGSGGFGDTYLAQDLDLPGKPKCVVKHLSPKSSDPGVLTIAQRLFEREAETLYKLGKDSDQIPKLFAHFQERTEFYLVQEYIEGQDISKELTPGKKLSESYTITLLKGILSALAVAHQNNIIHRDIKPENLMRRKSDKKIVLIDFGAVKEITALTTANKPGKTTLTVAFGTPGYMPSEQAIGKPKLSSDIYAVGMVGIKALTGKNPGNLPTDPNTGNVIWRNEAKVSNRLANILDRMVHEYFPQRYENATEVLEALVFTNSLQPIPAPITTPTQVKTVLAVPSPQKQPLLISTPTPIPVTTQAKTVLASTYNTNISIQKFKTVTVNVRGEIISHSPGKAEVMTENLGNGVILEMVKIPAGRFLMGSPETEAERIDWESPQHYVDVPEFFMGKYPVTQAQWGAIMGNNPSGFKGASRPVERVSWNDATEFCQKLSEITGKKYSLPSESQWEYACRAGTSTPFYFGETITSELVNLNRNNSNVNLHSHFTYAGEPKQYGQGTTDVGIFPPNAFGLYDMHGNVWEWCQDVWHDNYEGAPTDGSAWETGGDSNRRMLRGGCWYLYSRLCRSAVRGSNVADNLNYIRGFRIVSSVPVVSAPRY